VSVGWRGQLGKDRSSASLSVELSRAAFSGADRG
jgi:hypothetical protein